MKKPILAFVLCIFYTSLQAQFTFKRFELNTVDNSNPAAFEVINGRLYFQADDYTHGTELWVSDGTDTGTKMLADIVPGMADANPASFTKLGAQIIFTADSPAIGNELWITDGTTAGTRLLKDVSPGSSSSYISQMTPYNGKIYFRASTPSAGYELWETDGTGAGTKMVKDIWNGTAGSYPDYLTVYNGKLYFWANIMSGYDLWDTDGTTAGTMVANPFAATGAGLTAGRNPIAILNNKHYFLNPDGGGSNTALYCSDGPKANMQLVKIIHPSKLTSLNILLVAYNKIYFRTDDGIHGLELWVSDGTSAGTYMLKDITPTVAPSSSQQLFAFNDKVFFNANDNVHGEEMWVTDGTDTGTHLFLDIFPGAASSSPAWTTVFRNKLYFNTQNGLFRYIYCTDGTVAGTKLVAPANAQTNLPQTGITNRPIVFNNTLYMQARYDTYGNELWALNDTSIYVPPLGNMPGIYQQASITLYPNPAHHVFMLHTTTTFKTGSVTLTDITGKTVLNKYPITDAQLQIPLNDIAPGMYMADIWLDDKRSVQKLMIE